MTLSTYKVLIADDDPAMLRLLDRWLTGAGYAVRSVADGREALEAIESDCPDFIITDWIMPHLNGIELCGRVRKMQLPHYVYIVMLTVKNGAEELIAGLENGADDFLTKPISQNELLARMKSSSRVLELERQLNLMAHTDSLTSLLTQRCFYKLLEKEWHRSKRSHLPLSCVMMDLDYFKQVNDVHGHSVGDSVLKCVAELLLDNCRVSDTVCRYGGEEFCVMLPDTDENNAALWADRARKKLESLRTPEGLNSMTVTGSFGVAECDEDLKNSEYLVDLADQALLRAKRMGRNRVIRYSTLADAAKPASGNSFPQDGVFNNHCARDLMSPLKNCLRENDTVEYAADYLLREKISSSAVLNDSGALAGSVSEKDLMVVLASPGKRKRSISCTMRTNVICYEVDTPLAIINEFICRASIRELVITDHGRPVGIINRGSLLRWLHDSIPGENGDVSPDQLSHAHEDNTTGMVSAPILHTPDNAPARLLGGTFFLTGQFE